MALPSSGPLSMSQIQAEFGGANPISLSEYYGVAAGVPASGTISIGDFYGKSNSRSIIATGGTISDSGGYRYHTFLAAGTFTVSQTAIGTFSNTLQVLVCGGGGPGGLVGGGGGNAGAASSFDHTAAVRGYAVTVGLGAAGTKDGSGIGYNAPPGWGANGGASAFHTGSVGGGQSGGSGNGVLTRGTNGKHSSGMGAHDGATGAARGGGGAGSGGNGNDAVTIYPVTNATGGPGYVWLNGTRYGGGGGGGIYATGGDFGYGGQTGGGTGQDGLGAAPTNATYYGAGGGGQGWLNTQTAGSGYQGIIIIRYQY